MSVELEKNNEISTDSSREKGKTKINGRNDAVAFTMALRCPRVMFEIHESMYIRIGGLPNELHQRDGPLICNC